MSFIKDIDMTESALRAKIESKLADFAKGPKPKYEELNTIKVMIDIPSRLKKWLQIAHDYRQTLPDKKEDATEEQIEMHDALLYWQEKLEETIHKTIQQKFVWEDFECHVAGTENGEVHSLHFDFDIEDTLNEIVNVCWENEMNPEKILENVYVKDNVRTIN